MTVSSVLTRFLFLNTEQGENDIEDEGYVVDEVKK